MGKPAKEPGRETPTNGTSPEQEDAERPVEIIDPQLKEKYRKQLHNQARPPPRLRARVCVCVCVKAER